MRRVLHSTLLRSAALIGALGLAACAESPVGAPAPSQVVVGEPILPHTIITDTTYSSGVLQADSTLWFRRVWVCKVGTSATFSVVVNGGAPTTVALDQDECRQVHYYAPGWQGTPDSPYFFGADTVTVTEVLDDPLVKLDSIQRDSTHNFTKYRLATLTGTNTVTSVVTRSKGSILTFFNSEIQIPIGGQGCTPGYWKQSQHFDSWNGYAPNQLFSSVFENAFPGKTLLDVLRQGGGGLNALGRHTVAALLNASQDGVNYDIGSANQVIEMFNAAYASGEYETLKNHFAFYNEQGCPIN